MNAISATKKERKISFIDAENNVARLEISIESKGGFQERETKHFSISGNYNGSLGQCQNSIQPANDAQKKLLQLWHDCHLNDMNAGTKKQSALVKACPGLREKRYDYSLACEYLDSISPSGEQYDIITLKEIHALRDDLKLKLKELEDIKKAFAERVKKDLKNDGVRLHEREFNAWLPYLKKAFKISDINLDTKRIFTRYTHLGNKHLADKFDRVIDAEKKQVAEKLKAVCLKTALYDIHPEYGVLPKTEELYKYGHEWIYFPLPDDIEQQVDDICDQVEEAEKVRIAGKPAHTWDSLAIDESIDNKAVALGKFLEINPADIDQVTCEEGNRYDYAGESYLICNDDEANEETREYVKESLWAFRPEFLANFTELPQVVFETLANKCEDANPAVLKIVESQSSHGLYDITQAAIAADGRGHFLNSYNGQEYTEEVNGVTYYIYNQ